MTFRQLCHLCATHKAWDTLHSMRDISRKTAETYIAASRRFTNMGYLYELGNEALADSEYANDLLTIHEPRDHPYDH